MHSAIGVVTSVFHIEFNGEMAAHVQTSLLQNRQIIFYFKQVVYFTEAKHAIHLCTVAVFSTDATWQH